MNYCIDFLAVCDVDKIGDFICQEDQNIPECGFDSGDCCNQFSFLPTVCHVSTGVPFLPCTYYQTINTFPNIKAQTTFLSTI